MKQVCEKWGVRRSEARSRGVLVKEGNREVPISRARKGTLEALAGDLGVVPLVRQALLPRLKVVLEGVLAEQATQESREDPGGAEGTPSRIRRSRGEPEGAAADQDRRGQGDAQQTGLAMAVMEAPSPPGQGPQAVAEARAAELAAFRRWKVTEEVRLKDYPDVRPIPLIWRGTNRMDGSRKERICARGDLLEGDPNIQTMAPTATLAALRVLLAEKMRRRWDMVVVDISTAFLQGKALSRVILAWPPHEANVREGWVWRLIQPVPGIPEAGKLWNEKVDEVMRGGDM